MSLSSFHSQGFQIVRNVFSETELLELRAEADRISTEAESACVRNVVPKSKMFQELAVDQRIAALLPENTNLVRSILFDKTPASNWPVQWHQDLTIAVREKIEMEGYGLWSLKGNIPHVQPPLSVLESMVTIRIHLDPTTEENGALKVISESHRDGIHPKKNFTEKEQQNCVTCECNPGDILLMRPLIWHSSARSTSPSHRRILHFEFAKPSLLNPRLQWHYTRFPLWSLFSESTK